ncbi:MAG: hypothetical protein U0931_31080 [Vulcanimicrobiota bacterium]
MAGKSEQSGPTRAERRRQQREAAKKQLPEADVEARRAVLTRLRRRVRMVLLLTTLIGFALLRFFHDQLVGPLQHFPVRLALVLALLSPALFTWMITLGELRDKK